MLGIGQLGPSRDLPIDASGLVQDWAFGHLAYEHGDMDGTAPNTRAGPGGWPASDWFVPRWVVEWQGSEARMHVMPGDEDEALAMARKHVGARAARSFVEPGPWELTTSRSTYLNEARRLLQHIQRGDIYEVNYCIERRASAEGLDPFEAFRRLLAGTDAPFAGFYRSGDRFALCASPERFLAFDGASVTGEPMKGTRPRFADREEDERSMIELANDPKERSENIMALDVMRNDLSRFAVERSVRVHELCAVRRFPRVHQMVSTVGAQIAPGHSQFDVVRACFPMASMTGAPKTSAMRLIAAAERRSRGLYSGTMGFFAPDGTADLNVVIRTLLYDAGKGTLSLSTGSALTALCDPAHEWEECALKARSVIDALSHA